VDFEGGPGRAAGHEPDDAREGQAGLAPPGSGEVVGLTLAARYVLSAAGLEPHLGPTILVYASLGLFLTIVAWLVLYRA